MKSCHRHIFLVLVHALVFLSLTWDSGSLEINRAPKYWVYLAEFWIIWFDGCITFLYIILAAALALLLFFCNFIHPTVFQRLLFFAFFNSYFDSENILALTIDLCELIRGLLLLFHDLAPFTPSIDSLRVALWGTFTIFKVQLLIIWLRSELTDWPSHVFPHLRLNTVNESLMTHPNDFSKLAG